MLDVDQKMVAKMTRRIPVNLYDLVDVDEILIFGFCS